MKAKKLANGKIELVFPTEAYLKQMESYLQEHLENGEEEIAGDASLDTIKDTKKWLEKVRRDVTRKEEGRVPASLYLAVRKDDDYVVGTIQIRHMLSQKLYETSGHIGLSVRPSQRRKGYATEMIRLALEKCRELGIDRVLMTCYEDNLGSRKSIQNNSGVLEKKVLAEDGKVDERYWISLKKRYATDIEEYEEMKQVTSKIHKIDDEHFSGYIVLHEFQEVTKRWKVSDKICLCDNGYKWLEFYDLTAKVCLTAIYNQEDEIVEWYFDIAKENGIEDGIPYEDDMYLDVALLPNQISVILDQSELENAYQRKEITKEEKEETMKIAKELKERIDGKQEELKQFTDYYLKKLKKDVI